MRSKIERAQRGPSGVEVILGALLSVVIGAVLGAAYLSVKPVPAVKEIPKDAAAGSVFYIEGLHDSGQGPEAGEKLRTLAAGGSVTLTETELNSLAGEAAKPQPSVAAKPGDKAAPAAAPARAIEAGPLNFRIHGGLLQIAAPVQFSAFGFDAKLIVQTWGAFAKRGNAVVFEPTAAYVGSCPVQRIPWAGTAILRRLLVPQPVPDDMAAAWSKLVDASIDGATLRLTTQ